MAKILLMTQGTAGDLFPFLRIGKGLRARGHEVTLMSHWFLAEEARKAGLPFVALNTPELVESYEEQVSRKAQDKLRSLSSHMQLVANHSQVAEREASAEAPEVKVMSAFGTSPERLVAECNVICGQCRSDDTILVSSYTSFIPAQTAAEKTGVPFVVIFPSPDLIPDWLTDLPFFDELYGMVGADINRVRDRLGLAPIHDWRAWLRYGDLHLGAWPDWLVPRRPDSRIEIESVGFFWDDAVTKSELPAKASKLLNGDRPPILICHGTSMPSKHEFFAVSTKACRLLGQPGMAVTRFKHLIPDPLPEGVEWFDYLPLGSVLPHVKAIIHHGGFNTAAQALAAGAPQLIVALGHDRTENAARFKALGIAESLPALQWQPDTVAGLLRGLMESPAVAERCKELAARFGECQLGAKAYELIEGAISIKTRRKSAAPPVEPESSGKRKSPDQERGLPGQAGELLKNLDPARRALLSSRLRGKLEAIKNLKK